MPKLKKDAIKKWEAIVDRTGVDQGPLNCSYCKKYYDYGLCYGCPIAEKAGDRMCKNTPYGSWRRHCRRTQTFDRVLPPKDDPGYKKALQAAGDMIEFIKSLPEE